MKAIVYGRYGGPEVLRIAEMPDPAAGPEDVLVRIMAASVTAADCMMRRADTPFGRLVLGFSKPRRRYRILGTEFSGVVTAVGRNRTDLQPGEAVYGFSGFDSGTYCDLKAFGRKSSLARKPENLDWEQAAAAVDGSTTALFFLRKKADLKRGEKLLVIGASGSIGSFAVQLGNYLGAEVTGVCSGVNRELVLSLGAKKVIDYTREEFTLDTEKYDVIFDTVGKSSFRRCKPVLNRGGRYLLTNGNMLRNVFLDLVTRLSKRSRFCFGMSVYKTGSLNALRELFEKEIIKPVMDRTFHFDEIAKAHRYVENGHKKGNVAVRVNIESSKAATEN